WLCLRGDAGVTSEVDARSLHDALPISSGPSLRVATSRMPATWRAKHVAATARTLPNTLSTVCGDTPAVSATSLADTDSHPAVKRSEEHTSELQSRENLVCRLLLEKKNK